MNIKKQLRITADQLIKNGAFDTQFSRHNEQVNKTLIALRNATIEAVFRAYDAQQPFTLYQGKLITIKALSEEQAAFHGIVLGGTIRSYRRKRTDYTKQHANKLAEIRQIAIDSQIIDVLLLAECDRERIAA